MKINKFLILLSISLLSSCEFIYINSNNASDSNSDNISNNNSDNYSDNLSVNENSSEINSSSSSTNVTGTVESFRSQIDRSQIIYTTYPENDTSFDINKLEIFQINDTHGAFAEQDEVVPISKVKGCIDAEAANVNMSVKIANGDILQGTAFSNLLLGEPAIVALNEMNFDCFVIGNHEFDWGIDKISIFKDGDESNGELKSAFLGANIVNSNGVMPDWIEPYTIVEKGDVTVGIIGVIGDGFESSISELSLNGYRFTSSTAAVTKYCNELKTKNVDVIIVAAHAHESSVNQQYVNNNDIDCIINAHDHTKITESVTRYDGKIIPVIESDDKNDTIGKVTLSLDSNNKMVSYTLNHYYPKNYSKDQYLDLLMTNLYDITSSYVNEEVGYKYNGFSKKDIATSTCDYIAQKYGADLVFVNTAGVRASISTSTITIGSVYEVFPFDNEIYITNATGSEIKSMIGDNYIGNYYYNNTGIGNGTSYDYSNLSSSKKYKIVTIDYVAGKSYMKNYFNSSHGLIKTGDYIRQCAIDNIKQNYKKS